MVSVLMVVRNCSEYLSESLASVFSQTYSDFECIVIDDGSDDNTLEVIRTFNDRRLVCIPRSADYIGNLNYGLSIAKGEYIARFDGDDIMLSHRLETQLAFMDAHPEIDVLGSGMSVFGRAERVYIPDPGRVSLARLTKTNIIVHPSVMFRTSSLRLFETHPYRSEYVYCEDYDLWIRMAEQGLCLWNIPDILIKHRLGPIRDTDFVQYQESHRLRLQYETGLTVIIPFLNEGEEVLLTVQNIRATAGNIPIILINDCSIDGYDYQAVAERYGCRYVEHCYREGVAASRDEGVALCETGFFLLLDGHMEFYEQGWDRRLVSILQANFRSVVCLNTRVLSETRSNPINDRGHSYGARVLFNETDIIKCKWVRDDPDPDANIIAIDCPLGAAYASSRYYWDRIEGLRGLVYYGMDEEMIALKVRRDGGHVLLVKDMYAGHLYRSRLPYLFKNDYMRLNQLLIANTLLDGQERLLALDRLREAWYSNGSQAGFQYRSQCITAPPSEDTTSHCTDKRYT
jgi:glycosyltransferase involved in cell wall biosynthesis